MLMLISTSTTIMLTLATTLPPEKVERWGIFEISMNGPKAGNPFIDVELSSQF